VERDLRARLDVGQAVLGSDVPAPALAGPMAAAAKVGELVGSSAGAIVDAATDEETQNALDKVAGRRWRLGVALLSVVVAAVRAMHAGRESSGPGTGATASGEPAPFPQQPDQPRTPRP
jgi:hypothetical protein